MYQNYQIQLFNRQLKQSMSKYETSSYKFQFFIMDIVIPQHYEANQCYVSLVSDQFEQILTQKYKVIDEVADMQATLSPNMILCLNRRSSEYRPPFVKLQVYITSFNNPNSHSVIGSMTFDLLQEIVNPHHKQIRQQLVGNDVRIRISITNHSSDEKSHNDSRKNTTINSVLKQIHNVVEPIDRQGKHQQGEVYKQGFHKQKFSYFDQKQLQDLNFSEIMPMDVSSRMNQSFQCKNKQTHLQTIRLYDQLQKLRNTNRDLVAQLEELKQINLQLDDINVRLSNDLRDADEKIIKMERHIQIYQQRIDSLDVLKLQIQNKSQNDQKNYLQMEARNLQMMKFINQLQENQLKLNHIIAQKTFEIEELSSNCQQKNISIVPSITSVKKIIEQWRKNNISNDQHKQFKTLVEKLIMRNQNNPKEKAYFHQRIEQELKRTSNQLLQLKKKYLFQSQISILNMVSSKIDSLLCLV